MPTNAERMQAAIGHLGDGLAPYCEEKWKSIYGDDWINSVNNQLHSPDRNPSARDIAFLFKGILATWNAAFYNSFGPEIRSFVHELRTIRNQHAHNEIFSTDDALRAFDTMERLLQAFGRQEEGRKIKQIRRELTRSQMEE